MSHPSAAKPRPGANPLARDLAAAVQRHRQGRLIEAAELYQRVLARQPRHADALHLLGLLEHGRGRQGEALALIERAIAADGRIAAFHIAHGTVLTALGQHDPAARALDLALAIDPAHPEALNALGNLRLAAGDAAAAVEAYRQALAVRPDYAEALSNLGSALRAQARWDEALATYDAALAADGAHPAARGNRAMLLLLLGRLEEGFAEYEARWQMPGFSTRRRDLGCAAWDGSPLDGQTLLVHAEQGLGSAIQFVRYAALAASRGARVVLESQAPLLRLFRQSLVGTGLPVEAVIRKGEALPSCDRQAPLMSLPHLLGTTLESIPADIPYLSASADDVAAWRQRLAATPMPRIGLVWAGNARHENDHNRSMPAASLAPLVAGTAASFFSLQVPAKPDDLDSLPPGRVTDLSAQLRDFADTAAVIGVLDLLITVDTAAAHLAGALGRPAWLLLPYIPEWRWLRDREDSPWYPSLRLFRQTAPGDWAGPVDQVRVALARAGLSLGRSR